VVLVFYNYFTLKTELKKLKKEKRKEKEGKGIKEN